MVKNSKRSKSSFRHIAAYLVSLIVILGCVATAAFFSLRSVVTSSRENAVSLADFRTREEVKALDSFMLQNKRSLELTAQVVDFMVANNSPDEEILQFMVSETENAARKSDSLFGNYFGIVKGHFVHGANWKPSEGYVPNRRPWYKEALWARGRTVLTKPFAGSRSVGNIVSYSRSLSDKKSVVAFTVPLISLNKFFMSVKKDSRDIWIVMDKDGLVVASSGEIRQGFNCRSSEAWGMDEEKLAREILIADGKPFDFTYNGEKKWVFSSTVQDSWYVVSLKDESLLFEKSRETLFMGILVFVGVFLFAAVLCTFAFRSRIRLVHVRNERNLFLKSLGRELLTPLNGILGMSRILLREVNVEQWDYVKSIQVSSTNLLSVVDDIQEIAKIESGEMELDPVQYDLYSLLKDCFDTVSPKALAKNLHFTLECDPDIPSSLWGDESRIRQIIVNLLSNAIQHTEVGEVCLVVNYDSVPSHTGRRLDESINLKILVKDSGLGTYEESPEPLFGIFRIFENGEEEESRFSLDLTKYMIEACGGEIMVKSRYGEGSSYMVTIPQLVLNVEPLGDFATRYKKDSEVDKIGQERLFAPEARILAVDDAELNLKVIRGLLKATRVQIDTALNGSQCLDMVCSKRYDLILLDNLMPMMDGRETYERMKRLSVNMNRDTPVIILVAGPVPQDKDSYLSVGFTDYIKKPLMEEDLLRVLKWYLPKRLILTREDLKSSPNPEMPSSPKSVNKNHGTAEIVSFDNKKSATHKIVDDVELDMVSSLKPGERMNVFAGFLDVKSGMEYCTNDEDFYTEMLSEYVAGNKYVELENFFAKEDWSSYQIVIHGVKSTSLTVGANELSEEAKSLEMACKSGDHNYVRRNHERVMSMYVDVVSKIKKGLENI